MFWKKKKSSDDIRLGAQYVQITDLERLFKTLEREHLTTRGFVVSLEERVTRLEGKCSDAFFTAEYYKNELQKLATEWKEFLKQLALKTIKGE